MFVARDIAKIQNVIDCVRLELEMWDFLNQVQRQSLERKILSFQQQLRCVKTYLGSNE